MVGYLVGTVVALLVGSWMYWKVRGGYPPKNEHELRACLISGLAAAMVAFSLYTVLGVRSWLDAGHIWWLPLGILALTTGGVQAVQERGRILRRWRVARGEGGEDSDD